MAMIAKDALKAAVPYVQEILRDTAMPLAKDALKKYLERVLKRRDLI